MILLEQQIKKFISTNLIQPYATWDSNVSYKRNTSVIYDNHIYRSIVRNNLNVRPDYNTGKWLRFGPDNSFASIDLRSHTASVIDKGLAYIEFKFDVQGFTNLAFSRVQGSKLDVTFMDSVKVIKTHSKTIGVDRLCADTWYKYYTCPVPANSALGKGQPVDVSIPVVPINAIYAVVKIHKNSNDDASIGAMVGGAGKDIGDTQFGVDIDIIDYSNKVTDKNGITELTERESREVLTCDIEIPAVQSQVVKRVIKDALGHPLMFIADPDKDSNYEHLLLFGYISEYRQSISNNQTVYSTIKIEEVI